jgi:CsoR family transcriptional regulator, copper-sensing transcriptional repressor
VAMDNLTSSLNRIEGQVRGIKKMIQEKRDCEQIAQQIAAVQSALKRVGKDLLTVEAVRCSEGKGSTSELKKVIDSLVKIS